MASIGASKSAKSPAGISTEQRRPDGREDLLRVAVDLFAAHGFAGTSIRDIARAADCSISNVYHHFQSKERLWLAVLKGSIDDLPASLRAVLEAPGDHTAEAPLDRFDRLVRAHVATSHRFPRESRILFIDEGHLSPENDAANRQLQYAILKIYIAELEALARLGVVRNEGLKIKALNVLGVVNWHLRWMRGDTSDGQRAAEADAIAAFVLRGIDERRETV